ncbi:MAG TPA: bifunctional UDP-N-acetylglucosamine diphosphorylase/glucosamine-1-phosphate N-acetyltransferase GlmU [Blastocatellia bacterium]|nr:bifunctional UDP-N-acetylglucosamine diphosphorylase/glucosamine-1-phosphate N-acetyltransferase GlmU [Blastocatellia bacterium]
MKSPINVLILAAGLGTRMKSSQAKVLHKLGSCPMIARALRAAAELAPENIFVIVGHQAGKVEEAARASFGAGDAEKLRFVMQSEQRGTGHAVKCASDMLKNLSGRLVVFYGDTPAVKAETLRKLASEHERAGNAATLITIRIDPPPAYGRIIRTGRDGQGDFLKIVEERDCSPEERAVTELNPGFYCFDIQPLLDALDRLSPHNAQNEYYLTDVPQRMLEAGLRVGTVFHDDARELDGVNTRAELAAMWKRLRHETIDRLMADGVTIVDPDSTYIDDTVEIGRDTVIHPQVIIEGDSRIGGHCEILSWSRLVNAEIGDECKILNSCVIVSSKLTAHNTVGPFAHLRLHTELAEEAMIGNFVEVKKSRLGRKTKSMHLTYLGDATIGDRVNIGAGTVTCNYDGKQKNPTFIEDDVKIGSDTMLVAPVRVGRGSVTGAGSVVIKDTPPDSLVAGVPAQVKKKLKE